MRGQKDKEPLKDHAPHLYDIPGYDKVNTEKAVEVRRNYFAFVDGHYPASMSGCEVVGISGDCGFECPVFTSGGCQGHGAKMLSGAAKESHKHDPETLDIEELEGFWKLYDRRKEKREAT